MLINKWTKHPFWRGHETFYTIWFSFFISLSGTAMTRFALITWAYQQTGEATTIALLGFFSFITLVIASPFAGVYVDRFDRRLVMMFSDVGAGLITLVIFVLFMLGQLEIWHLFAAQMFTGVFDAFYIPAFSASISMTVDKSFYDRAHALRSLGFYAAQVAAPFMAGLILALTDLSLILVIDIFTFVIAVGALLRIRIPRPKVSIQSAEIASQKILTQIRFGFRYIWERRGLTYLLGLFTGIELIATITYMGILPAMVLARTGGDELALATVQSALGISGVVGGIIITVFGTPKRRIHGVLIVTAMSFLLGDFVIGIGQTTIVWALGGFLAAVFIPTIMVCNNTIWQNKVEPEVQGRVFAIKEMMRNSARPFGYLIAGPLADELFEPAMMEGGALADIFGGLVGTGDGAGMGLMFVCTAIMGTTLALSGYLVPALRNVEEDLPDYEPLDVTDDNNPEILLTPSENVIESAVLPI